MELYVKTFKMKNLIVILHLVYLSKNHGDQSKK